MRKLCLACLLNFAEQFSLAEFERRWDLSDQKTKKGTSIKVEKLSFCESVVKIRNVVDTPTSRPLSLGPPQEEITFESSH